MKLLKHWRIIWILNVFLGYMLFSSANWVIRKFGEVTYEQIMFHLNHYNNYNILHLIIFLSFHH